MSSAFANLNLRPQERRLVVFVGIILFVVLNIWLVWPHFGDWGLTQSRFERAQKTLASCQKEIAKVPGYRVKLRELQSAGSSVVLDEQELDLVRTVDIQARQNHVNVMQADSRAKTSMSTQTNRFFEEQYINLHVTTGNEELINFLVSLTSPNSLIRVKELSLKPDPSLTRLDGNMTVVASYQRKTPAKAQPLSVSPPTNMALASKAGTPRLSTRTNRPPATAASAALTNKGAAKSRPPNQPARKP